MSYRPLPLPSRPGRVFALYGRLRARPGRQVVLTLERRSRGRWVAVRRVTVRVRRGGRFRTLVGGLAPGRYRVRARQRGGRWMLVRVAIRPLPVLRG